MHTYLCFSEARSPGAGMGNAVPPASQDGQTEGYGRQGTDRTAASAKSSKNGSGTTALDDQPSRDVPEDVAILHSWANLQGAKYRDFSASRREYRAQMRRRAAEPLREQELQAAAEAAVAEAAGGSLTLGDEELESEYGRLLTMQEAEQAARKAFAERSSVHFSKPRLTSISHRPLAWPPKVSAATSSSGCAGRAA
jgi:hypothetical protein